LFGKGWCTQLCIGSGKADDPGCPSGYACFNVTAGDLDGTTYCERSSELSSTWPGQPFTLSAGSSCASQNACQTSVCSADLTCGRSCQADRDCNAGEGCWALPDGDGVLTGYHYCYPSDPANFKVAGQWCSEHAECDSGICAGYCDDGRACRVNADCGLNGGTCSPTCVSHCRDNSDCGSGDGCIPFPVKNLNSGWSSVCMPKFFNGTQTDGTTCSVHSDCTSDWCVSGICTQPCGVPGDCAGVPGTTCKPYELRNGVAVMYRLPFCVP